jgi:hypothetical protein
MATLYQRITDGFLAKQFRAVVACERLRFLDDGRLLPL